MSQVFDAVTVGIVSVSDRASSGVYEDKGLPALQEWLTRALHNPITFEARLIAAALNNTKGRRIDAAQQLGIGRNTITRKIQELEAADVLTKR